MTVPDKVRRPEESPLVSSAAPPSPPNSGLPGPQRSGSCTEDAAVGQCWAPPNPIGQQNMSAPMGICPLATSRCRAALPRSAPSGTAASAQALARLLRLDARRIAAYPRALMTWWMGVAVLLLARSLACAAPFTVDDLGDRADANVGDGFCV